MVIMAPVCRPFGPWAHFNRMMHHDPRKQSYLVVRAHYLNTRMEPATSFWQVLNMHAKDLPCAATAGPAWPTRGVSPRIPSVWESPPGTRLSPQGGWERPTDG